MTRTRQILGIVGLSGSGKSALAETFRANYDFVELAMAAPLKEVVGSLFGLSYAQLYGWGPLRETVDPRWGRSPREILQVFATEVTRQIHADVWTRAWLDRVNSRRLARVVVPDVRFQNEIDMIRSLGGRVIRIWRPGHDPRTTSTAAHVSESGQAGLVGVEGTIVNDSTLDVLATRAAGLYEQLWGDEHG